MPMGRQRPTANILFSGHVMHSRDERDVPLIFRAARPLSAMTAKKTTVSHTFRLFAYARPHVRVPFVGRHVLLLACEQRIAIAERARNRHHYYEQPFLQSTS